MAVHIHGTTGDPGALVLENVEGQQVQRPDLARAPEDRAVLIAQAMQLTLQIVRLILSLIFGGKRIIMYVVDSAYSLVAGLHIRTAALRVALEPRHELKCVWATAELRVSGTTQMYPCASAPTRINGPHGAALVSARSRAGLVSMCVFVRVSVAAVPHAREIALTYSRAKLVSHYISV